MRTHVINIQLKIEARDWISRADLIADLRKQLEALQEQQPYRHNTGGGWWTNSPSAVTMLKYSGIAEQIEYEIEAGLRARLVSSEGGRELNCPECLMPMVRRPDGMLVHADPADATFCSVTHVDDGVEREG